MQGISKWVTAMAIMAVAGCGDKAGNGLSPTEPLLLVGPTASVSVSCPTQMETGTSGTCDAYGYDSNGTYTNSNESSWSSSNTGVATITSTGQISAVGAGTATITAVIDGVAGSTTVTVVNPSSTPLSVTIDGPTHIRPNTQCAWWASASGGTPGYTYSWSGGTGSAYDYEYYAQSSSSFYVTVQVTDSNGQVKTVSKYVKVSTSAPLCAL
jgi:hypothetical protein